MIYRASALAAWLLTYEMASVSFVDPAFKNQVELPPEIISRQQENTRKLLNGNPPSIPMVIGHDGYNHDQWESDSRGVWNDGIVSKRSSELDKSAFLYAHFSITNDEIDAEIFIDKMGYIMNRNFLAVRTEIPDTLIQSLIGQPASQVLGHMALQDMPVIITSHDTEPAAKFNISQEHDVEIKID